MNPYAVPSLFGVPVDTTLEDQLPLGTPVRLLHTAAASFASARVTGIDDGCVRLALSTAADFIPGTRVILERGDTRADRHVLTVLGVFGRTLLARRVGVSAQNRREYPRLNARLGVRFRPSRSPEDAASWLAGAPLDGTELAAAPLMNFSPTGLAFDTPAPAPEGDALLLDIAIPGDRRHWRATAGLLRTLPPENGGPGHRLAVAFDEIPVAATLALVGYSLRVQQVFLEGEEEPTEHE